MLQHVLGSFAKFRISKDVVHFRFEPDYSSVPAEGVLIDIDDISLSNSPKSYREKEDFVVVLLRKQINGYLLAEINGRLEGVSMIVLMPGMMLRTIDDGHKRRKVIEVHERSRLMESRGGLLEPMEVLTAPLKCAMISSADAMSIQHSQALQLLSVPNSERLQLYHDVERFNFLMNLRVGSRVAVDLSETMRRVPGKVSWIGERPGNDGLWYKVDFDSQWPPSSHDRIISQQFDSNWNSLMSGSSTVVPTNSRSAYYSPNQLHMPLKGGGVAAMYDNRRPVTLNNNVEEETSRKARERIIPVTRRDAPTTPHQHQQQQQAVHHESNYSRSAQSAPSRSKSVHSIPIKMERNQPATKNEPVRDDRLRFRIGDPCIWNNNGTIEKGTVKFIGYLKGHTGIYAGVEFKNQIGAGTGIFSGEQLFNAKNGHAGFVEMTTLDVPSPSTSSHRRRLSSSRSQNIGGPAAAGSSVSVPVNRYPGQQQASSESLFDAPPPPYAPPSPPPPQRARSAQPPPLPPKPMAHIEDYLIESFEIGSRVNVCHLGAQKSGVVRWLGDAMNEQGDGLERSAVVQLDDNDAPSAWRKSSEAPDYMGSPVSGGVLVPVVALRRCRVALPPYSVAMASTSRNGEFGSVDSGVEKQKCAPAKEIHCLIGRQKGIQGYCNSCYIDATLYAMFVQSTNFDFLLEKPIKGNENAALFQKILAHEIVFPLRKFHYVRADHVMRLRQLLAELMPHMSGLTDEEKDPEEILAFIFAKIFKAEPFIRLIGADKSEDSQYLVPIVVDSDWQGGAATSQHLLERHMRAAQVKFVKPPPVLIMQLPRYGQQKVFDKILPLEQIDITPFVAGAVPACSGCGNCAEVYCPTCFLTRRVFFNEIVYCDKCFAKSHLLPEISDHLRRDMMPPPRPQKKPNSHKMVLTAVLCIETSHYVAFVRTSTGQWVFFDSMADREGLSDGFNVPVVQECADMSYILSMGGWQRLKEADETGQIKAMFSKDSIDPLVSRLLSDSYICFYEDSSLSNPSNSASFINTFRNMVL
ncbi:unnamed protein product [Caenorhabditis bovis]|uniref:ubiquitinyl hydrolase 1 n=1 Tax=Caenorhabditis bovis TaxID=2654633 RepID=A0A8S1EJ72_9PELO|nr:unnamed protein product [Caenorhabditis bovis]